MRFKLVKLMLMYLIYNYIKNSKCFSLGIQLKVKEEDKYWQKNYDINNIY